MKLSTFTTKGGARFTVADAYRDQFEGLLNDLEASGYAINPEASGGYNNRNIAGTNKLSNHAHGSAVDVNWNDNARGSKGNIDPDLAKRLADKWGMRWGGTWSNPDPMHFEIAHGEAGHVHQPGDEASASAPQGDTMDFMKMISGLFQGGAGNMPGGGAQPQMRKMGPQGTGLNQWEAPVPSTAGWFGQGDQQQGQGGQGGMQLPFGLKFGGGQGVDLGALMKQSQAAPAPIQAPQLGTSARQPIDMARLAQIISSRARLGV